MAHSFNSNSDFILNSATPTKDGKAGIYKDVNKYQWQRDGGKCVFRAVMCGGLLVFANIEKMPVGYKSAVFGGQKKADRDIAAGFWR